MTDAVDASDVTSGVFVETTTVIAAMAFEVSVSKSKTIDFTF